MTPRTTLPYIVLVILLGATCAAIMRTGELVMIDDDPVRTVLPTSVGAWRGEAVWSCLNAACRRQVPQGDVLEEGVCPDCGERLHGISFTEARFLPPDTRIIRSKYTHTDGRVLYASVVLSGKGRISIHRPQVCLTGGGSDIVETTTMAVDVEHGPRLPVTVLDMTTLVIDERGSKRPLYSYYAYWFAGRDHETARHLSRMFWMAADKVLYGEIHPWAYIAITASRAPGNDDHFAEIRDFLKAFAPRIRVGDPGGETAEVGGGQGV